MLLRQGNSSHWLLTFALNYAPFVLALIFVSWPPAWTRPAPDGSRETRRRALPRTLAWCLAGSAAVLALRHGFYNDWAMRVTLPLSIMLAVALTKVLLGGMKWPYLAVLLAVLLISSASSLAELTRSVLEPTNCKRYGTYALGDMGELTPQYEGRSDSLCTDTWSDCYDVTAKHPHSNPRAGAGTSTGASSVWPARQKRSQVAMDRRSPMIA